MRNVRVIAFCGVIGGVVWIASSCGHWAYVRGLPRVEYDYVVLDKAGGVRDLCYLGDNELDVLKRLGRPDSYHENRNSGTVYRYYSYPRYGLKVETRDGELVGIAFKDLTEESVRRIRLTDDEGCWPKTRQGVVEAYGKPKCLLDGNVEKDIVQLFRDKRPWERRDGEAQTILVYPHDRCFFKFVFCREDMTGVYIGGVFVDGGIVYPAAGMFADGYMVDLVY